MLIPEDGQLPPIRSAKLNLSNNIMIVKVDDKSKKPGETTYQLATLNCSKKGNVWPADNFVGKLLPDLPKIKARDESNKELDAKKEFDVPCNKISANRSRPFRRSGRNKYRSAGMRRPNLARQRKWGDRTEVHNRSQPAKNIEPWIKNPWESQSNFNVPEVTSGVDIHSPVAPYNISYSNFPSNMSYKGFLGRCPPNEFGQGHSSLVSCPSANSSLENHYSGFPEDCPPGNSFGHPEPHTGDSSKHFYKHFVSQPRGGPSPNNYSAHSKPDMLRFEPYNNYIDSNRGDYSAHYMSGDNTYSEFCREDSSGKIDFYNKFGKIQRGVGLNKTLKTYASNSRQGPLCAPPFENYLEPTRDISYNHADVRRNETLNEAPYRKPFPPMKNNTEQWSTFASEFNSVSTSRDNANPAPQSNVNAWRGNKFRKFKTLKKGFRNRRQR